MTSDVMASDGAGPDGTRTVLLRRDGRAVMSSIPAKKWSENRAATSPSTFLGRNGDNDSEVSRQFRATASLS
ncbi:hypothetical protein JCM18920_540 [Cutibacterium acnes JCM 18920]|uniref:Uncharacterized protein n=1 Tax=Cutibacterium acnes (strain DSM 16379 / KPA171202) TaxID=267747 RepID=Q6A983_CUTAK|nr:hypothetical protein PPA0930 [Cutibacterium acnes KPA171202]EFD02756.1 hypothetical protein HMPREF1034_0082 [Cutibacterium acnes SK187]EGL42800.1 hypothetical protein HMPREF9947_1777 [Propionibacterium sp. 409-HC1]EGL44738.1 hypothetical protein HMPREF9948_1563 [Propionibacterium sp. 434-HC2]EGR90952.1 hypothetical protein HMPREF9949_1717 [Propionibacterium sp. CC003-HC2]GAE79001.1 hypothetical protein JCM18920_540 [Cutibacterium acnes JCM 18920]